MTKLFGYTNYWAVSGWVGLIFILFIFWPDTASAQTVFKSIVDIPGITGEPGATENFGIYINALYVFAITVGAMLAVLKLVAAGVKYMFSDIVTNKESAKNDIKGAILGLLIVIGAVVILNTVNTDLTEVDLNLSDASVDANDHFGDALRRIQDLIASCTEPSCTVIQCTLARTISGACQSECESYSPSSVYIPGGLLSSYTGGQLAGQCLKRHEGTDLARRQCEAEGRIWDNDNSQCIDIIPGTQVELITTRDYYFGRYISGFSEAEDACRIRGGVVSGRHLDSDSIICSNITPNITNINEGFTVAQIDTRITELTDDDSYSHRPDGDRRNLTRTAAALSSQIDDCVWEGGNHFEVFDMNYYYRFTCWRHEVNP